MSELKVGDRVVLKRNIYHAFDGDEFAPGTTGEVIRIIDFTTHKVFVVTLYSETKSEWAFFDYELEILL